MITVAKKKYSHDPYCLSFWDNHCRCRCPNCGYYHDVTITDSSGYITGGQNDLYLFPPPTLINDATIAAQQLKAEERKHQIYYEAIGRCRELAKTQIPDIIPKIRLEIKEPSNKCHKLRCMKMQPRLSILKRIAKKY